MTKTLLNKIIESETYDARTYRYVIVGGEYTPGTKRFGSVPHIVRKPLADLNNADVGWEHVARI